VKRGIGLATEASASCKVTVDRRRPNSSPAQSTTHRFNARFRTPASPQGTANLRSLPCPDAQRITLQAALVGQHGLRLQDPARIHNLDNFPNPLTALEVACLFHAGPQTSMPGTDSGFLLEGCTGWCRAPETRAQTRPRRELNAVTTNAKFAHLSCSPHRLPNLRILEFSRPVNPDHGMQDFSREPQAKETRTKTGQ
jgi:hypothetical protein